MQRGELKFTVLGDLSCLGFSEVAQVKLPPKFSFASITCLDLHTIVMKRDGICPVQGTCTSPVSSSLSEQEKQALFPLEKTRGLFCASQTIYLRQEQSSSHAQEIIFS